MIRPTRLPLWARMIGAGVNLYLAGLVVWSVLWFVAGERIALIQQLGMVFDIQVRQGEEIAAYALRNEADGPVIALGDANGTEQSGIRRRLVENLVDSWREAGWGLGHTWGGSALPRRPFGELWIARIDYVLHSKDLVALDARVAEHDGVSDHRGVIVRLAPRSDRERDQGP